jgi:flavin-dependent dehydrogenase
MSSTRDIVILGAGLAGSSLATVLSSLGWDVLLLERRTLPSHKVCGEFLSPESQASLLAMGLYDSVAALEPAPMRHAMLTTPAGVRLRVGLPGDAWGVSRFALDAALAQAAAQAGAEVRMGETVTDIAVSGHGCTVETRTTQQHTTIQARAAIAACGRHPLPALRPAAERAAEQPARQTYVGVTCHYRQVEMPAQVELYLFPGGYVGLGPVEQGAVNLCLLATRESFKQAGGSIDEMLEAIARWNPALGRRLAGGEIVEGSQMAVSPVDTGRPATVWEHVARVGDAVTMIPPLCGDGMAMALRSAELCAPLAHEFLQGHLSLAAWEASYRAQWHAEFEQTLRTGRHLQALLALPGVADMLLAAGNLLPFLAAHLVKATRGAPRPLDSVHRLAPAVRHTS